MECDRIYVNPDGHLICDLKDEKHTVNMNYLRFLNKYNECFLENPYTYHPRYRSIYAERLFQDCLYEDYWKKKNLPTQVSLCSLNQMFLAQESVPEFWEYDPDVVDTIEDTFPHNEEYPLDWFYQEWLETDSI